MTEEQKEDVRNEIFYFGMEEQITVCMEECSELIQAISKVKRYGLYKERNKENLIEEIADVSISIELLKQMFSVSDQEIENWIKFKLERTKSRMSKTTIAEQSSMRG